MGVMRRDGGRKKNALRADLPRRECRLPSCRKVFTPTREWQDFHDDACRKAYWKMMAKASGTRALHNEVVRLRKEVTQLQTLIAKRGGK